MAYHEKARGLAHLQQQEQYTYRMPEGPKQFNPPHVHTTEAATLGPLGLNPHVYNIEYFNKISPPFISPVTLTDKSNSWHYKLRRQMQEILPFLYLGPASAVTQFTESHPVTLLVGIQLKGINFLSGAIQAGKQRNIDTRIIIIDTLNDLISKFPQTTKLINDHINNFSHQSPELVPKILVFCETGSEKSAAVVASYLCETYTNLDMQSAMQICITRRFSCNFGPVSGLLDTYQQLVNARNVLSPILHGRMSIPEPIVRVKTPDMNGNFRRERDRFLHNIDDEEFADRERFEGRAGPQPFKDAI